MQITYNGVVIAQEPIDGGTDSVSGFLPVARANVQWVEFLRGDYSTPLPLNNRKTTLTGIITLGSTNSASASLASAMQDRFFRYSTLPDSGELKFQSGSTILLFPGAVLESFEPTEDNQGVLCAYRFTFLAGLAQLLPPSGTPMVTGSGDTMVTGSGDTMVTP